MRIEDRGWKIEDGGLRIEDSGKIRNTGIRTISQRLKTGVKG